MKSPVAVTLAGAAMAAIATTASAQNMTGPGLIGANKVAIDGHFYGGGLPLGAEKNLDAVRLLIKAADAMGQLRDNQYGGSQYLVLGDTTNAMRMVANGTWNGQPAHVVIDWDLRVPGVRIDVQSPDGKTRDVQVGSGALAWDESKPGIFRAAAKTSANERLVIAYLMPSGVVLAGRDSADKIKVSKDSAGHNVLTLPIKVLGTDMVATLDVDGHPVHTQIALNGKTYTGDFENFLNDRADNEVKFPHKVSLKLDGKPLADLVLDWHQANPYAIFPVPKEVAAK